MHLILEIGSYAGLAAIVGLAVLSALYFSQARDVKRLREWAGRAPERAAEQAAGGRTATQAATPAARAAQQQPAAAQVQAAQAAQPAARAAAAGGAAPAVGSATATAARPAGAVPSRPAPGAPVARRPGAPHMPGGQTAILGTARPPDEPWYRRYSGRLPAGRYLALIVAGVVIVGGGVAYAVTQMGSSSSSNTAAKQSAGPAKKAKIVPANVTVAVLNSTGAPGLARTIGHKLSRVGFKLGNLDNASGGARPASVVMFKPGKNAEAGLVARRLHINTIEPIDAATSRSAGGADVVVLVGKDKAPSTPSLPAGPSGSGGTAGGGATGGGTAPGAGTATPGAGGTGGGAAPGTGTATPGAGGTGGTGTPGAGTGTPGGTGVPGQ